MGTDSLLPPLDTRGTAGFVFSTPALASVVGSED